MRVLITGGAGFIGSHCAAAFLQDGAEVTILDNFSRLGSRKNAVFIRELHGGRLTVVEADVRDFGRISEVFQTSGAFDLVFHMAAQVAVTFSVTDPRNDFEVNSLGTFNVLEALRLYQPEAAFIYSSTNKVYGKLDDLQVRKLDSRYEFEDLPDGVSETRPLDFYSPYGCSKGTGDQYTLDYGRIYGLRTVSLRKSCIYGPRQFGMEDQGWVAWFCIGALLNRPLTIYGDGLQVRDILYIDDLIAAYKALWAHIDAVKGQAFNCGGGIANTLSLRELVGIIEQETGEQIDLSYADWRPGDQRVFVSDTAKLERMTGWQPAVQPKEGVARLTSWIRDNRSLVRDTLSL